MNERNGALSEETVLDDYTRTLLEALQPSGEQIGDPGEDARLKVDELLSKANQEELTEPIVELFTFLLHSKRQHNFSPEAFGIDQVTLENLALKHQQIDEHLVSVGA